jgi:hypothetical protein
VDEARIKLARIVALPYSSNLKLHYEFKFKTFLLRGPRIDHVAVQIAVELSTFIAGSCIFLDTFDCSSHSDSHAYYPWGGLHPFLSAMIITQIYGRNGRLYPAPPLRFLIPRCSGGRDPRRQGLHLLHLQRSRPIFQTLVKHWSNTGQTPVKSRASTSPAGPPPLPARRGGDCARRRLPGGAPLQRGPGALLVPGQV